jgi:hypothetical protein
MLLECKKKKDKNKKWDLAYWNFVAIDGIIRNLLECNQLEYTARLQTFHHIESIDCD